MSRTFSGAVNRALGLAGDSQDCERGDFTVLDAGGDWVASKSDYVVGICRRVLQRSFPQPVGVRRSLPRAMIAFVDHAGQGNASLLEGADVAANVHQESGVGWHHFQMTGKFS